MKFTKQIKKGTFTKKATAKGLSDAQFQKKVLANPKKYSPTTVRQANLRKTLVSKKFRK